jgi:hypothetical protein
VGLAALQKPWGRIPSVYTYFSTRLRDFDLEAFYLNLSLPRRYNVPYIIRLVGVSDAPCGTQIRGWKQTLTANLPIVALSGPALVALCSPVLLHLQYCSGKPGLFLLPTIPPGRRRF